MRLPFKRQKHHSVFVARHMLKKDRMTLSVRERPKRTQP